MGCGDVAYREVSTQADPCHAERHPAGLAIPVADAHRSGCHRWHSCPSDTGSYVCGDLGHCSGCPDNEYCLGGQPRKVSSEQERSSQQPGGPQPRAGVRPQDQWTCPTTYSIKGNFTTYSGERCIYHMPDGQFYDKTKPERCYATEDDATQDGCRRSKR
jgi:hypothetical protein